MVKKVLADFFSWNDIFPLFFFFSFPKGNRNISFLFTAQLIVGFYLKRLVRPPSRHRHWSNYGVIMCLSGCVMLEGGLFSWESQSHSPSMGSLGSGGLPPAALPTNVFLGLLLFLIAHKVLLTSKVLTNQDHQRYLGWVSGNRSVTSALCLWQQAGYRVSEFCPRS